MVDQGGGGDGAGGVIDGGAGGENVGGSGGTGGGDAECTPLNVTDEILEECPIVDGETLPHADTTICGENSRVTWPAVIYEVPVAQGDCFHFKADNVGGPGADLFGAVVDPAGASLYFDDELGCAVDNPDGFDCPEGATTMTASGTAYVVVGAWEGNGCEPLAPTSFELSVDINGVAFDLENAPVCAADLLVVLP